MFLLPTTSPRQPCLFLPPADKILQCDREISELLEDKVRLFADILALQSCSEDGPLSCVNPRTLFRTESSDTPQGEKLIQEAVKEGSKLLHSRDTPHLGSSLLPPMRGCRRYK